jgi:hypothetical protein
VVGRLCRPGSQAGGFRLGLDGFCGRRRLTRQEEIARKREELAFGAATGAKGDVKALSDFTEAALRSDLDLQNLDHAIAEARRRVKLAEQEAQQEAMRAKARLARGRLAELRQVGAEASRGLTAFVQSLERFYSLSDEIRLLNMGGPNAI